MVHRPLRQLRRGHGRGEGQGPGRHPAPGPNRDHGQPPEGGRLDRAGLVVVAHGRRRGHRVGRGDDPVRRRDHRRHRLGGRVGHHRGIGARHPGVGRRPLGRHRRHPGAVRPDHGPHHGQGGRDLPRPHDRPGGGRLPAEDAQRDSAEHPAGGPDHHLPAGHRHPAALRRLLRRRAAGHHPGRTARLPHPDDDRRPAQRHRDRRDGPARAAQRAGHVRPGGGGGGRLRHPPARQDRDDHPRQPPGGRVPTPARGGRGTAGRGRPAGQPGRRDARGTLHRGPGQGALQHPGTRSWSAPSSSPSPPRPG